MIDWNLRDKLHEWTSPFMRFIIFNEVDTARIVSLVIIITVNVALGLWLGCCLGLVLGITWISLDCHLKSDREYAKPTLCTN